MVTSNTGRATGGDPTGRSSDLVRAAAVAHRFYVGQLTKQGIAEELGISRFKVARLLDLAREAGLVHIEVRAPLGIDMEFGQRVREAYGLSEAWVVTAVETSADALARRLGEVGAAMLADSVETGQPIGISWGRTMRALVDSLEGIPPCPIVQVAAGFPGDVDDSAAVTVRRLARVSGGEAHFLHAPLFVREAAVADSLRREPVNSGTLQRFAELQTVLVGIGAWDRERSAVASALRPEDLALLEDAGAVAEVCGLFLAADGSIVGAELASRAMAIRAEDMRAVPDVLAVAGGPGKEQAVIAFARSGLCSRLVTDHVVAGAMLTEPAR